MMPADIITAGAELRRLMCARDRRGYLLPPEALCAVCGARSVRLVRIGHRDRCRCPKGHIADAAAWPSLMAPP